MGYECSSTFSDGPMELWQWVGSLLLNIFVCLVSCYVAYLFGLRAAIFRLNGAERRESESIIADKHPGLTFELERLAVSRALSSMSAQWVYALGILEIYLAVSSSLITGLGGERACALALAILFALDLVVGRQVQRLRQDSTVIQDEEAQGHGREEPDLRTLPAIGAGFLVVVDSLGRHYMQSK